MADKGVSRAFRKSASIDYVIIEDPIISNSDVKTQVKESAKLHKSVSLDIGENENVKKHSIIGYGSLKRRSIRGRSSKHLHRPESEFRHDTETYEKIRERVLQERAVTNAIDALQERWRMIMFMYEDCGDLNKQRTKC